MKVTQEKLPDSQIGLEIEISAENSKNTYEKVVQNFARSANIPGFRKGKVPRPILLQRLGPQRIKAAALEEIIQKGLEEAIKQESIESLGNYQLRSSFEELVEKFHPGEAFTFSASVDVSPTVQLGDYKALSIKAEEVAYDPKQVEDWLEQRRAQQATLVPVEDRPAQMEDIAIIDYQGRFVGAEEGHGEAIPGVQGTDFRVDLVEGRFIAGMVEGIAGMKPEETKEVALTFPADYPREDLAGKPTVFTITLKELKSKELPELDDDFAEEVSEFATIAELRESLEKQFREKADTETKNNIMGSILAKIVDNGAFDLPDILIQKEVDRLLAETATQMQQYNVDLRQLFSQENIPQLRATARPEAIQRLKQILAIREIAKAEGIALEDEEIATRMKEIQEQLSDRDLDLDRLREVVTEEQLTEKILDWLQEKAAVELVPQGTLTPKETETESESEPEAQE